MTDLQSLFFYLLVFAVATVFIYLGNSKKYSARLSSLFVATGLIIPAILSGFRYGVGLDYDVYFNTYDNILDRSIADIFYSANGVEVLFGLLSMMSKALFNNPIPLFMLYGLMTSLFFYLGIRKLKLKRPWLLYFLFLLVVFPLSLNIIKQSLAISIVFFAISCAINREPRKSLLLTLLAMTSHTSAIIALPLIAIATIWQGKFMRNYNVRTATKYLVSLSLLGILFYLTAPYILENDIIDKYSDLYGSGGYFSGSGASPLRIWLKILVIGGILTLYRHLHKLGAQFHILFFFVLSELLILLIGIDSAPISRASLYLLPFSLVILSSLPDLFQRGFSKNIATIMILLFGVAYFILLYFMQGGSGIFPYKYWFGV